MKLLRDALMGIGNNHWDIARLTALWAVLSYSFAFLYALMWLKNVPDWSALGVGYAAVLAGAVAFVAGKDISTAKANATPSAAPVAPATPPTPTGPAMPEPKP
jgi:hypothetical protein